MFYSIADRFSKSHSILLGGSETDFVLIFVDIVLPVATGINIRDIIGVGADGSLINLSRYQMHLLFRQQYG